MRRKIIFVKTLNKTHEELKTVSKETINRKGIKNEGRST